MTSGPTGHIYKNNFEQLIEFDSVLRYDITNRDRYSYASRFIAITMFYHYFKDGVEVGYWCVYTSGGFIFETPRTWSKEFLEHPDFVLEEQCQLINQL